MGGNRRGAAVICGMLVLTSSLAGCATSTGRGGTSCAGLVVAEGRQYLFQEGVLARMPVGEHHALSATRQGCQDGPTPDEPVAARTIPGIESRSAIFADEDVLVPNGQEPPDALEPLTRPVRCATAIRQLQGTALFSGGRTVLRTTDPRLRTAHDEWVQVVLVEGGPTPDRATWSGRFQGFVGHRVMVSLACTASGAWGVTGIDRA